MFNSDHSSQSAVISMAQAVPNLFVSRTVFLKHQVYWNTVCGADRICPGIAFGLLRILLRLWTNICPCWLDAMYQPRFDDQCKHAFGLKQEAHLRWTRDRSWVNWEEFVHCQVRANETYSEAKREFSDRNRAVLMNVKSPLKSAVFGTS